jgi:hypothetical protein
LINTTVFPLLITTIGAAAAAAAALPLCLPLLAPFLSFFSTQKQL